MSEAFNNGELAIIERTIRAVIKDSPELIEKVVYTAFDCLVDKGLVATPEDIRAHAEACPQRRFWRRVWMTAATTIVTLSIGALFAKVFGVF